MSFVRAVWRRLDAWSALLFGVLVTLGVIILFAAPGPWHRVAPGATPHPPLAPPAPPNDVALFVVQGSARRCTGVLWLHIDYSLPRFTAIVVPAALTCLQPRAGFQSLDQIADESGAAVAATSLGGALGITMDAWLAVDPRDVRTALPGFLRQESRPDHPRPLSFAGVWTSRATAPALRRQMNLLRRLTTDWGGVQLNLVGFVNYVLGSRRVDTSMKLQAVSSIAAALQDATPTDFAVGTLPVVVERRGAYRRCLPLARPLGALRAAFAVDASSPTYPPTVVAKRAGDSVLVLTTPLSSVQQVLYRTAFRTALTRHGAGFVRVQVRTCYDPAGVRHALSGPGSERLLGAVLALGATATGTTTTDWTSTLLESAIAEVKAASLPTVVSEVPVGGDAAVALDRAIATQATEAGLPVSTVVPRPSTTATAAAGTAPGVWARANAATFARAVQPRFFAPTLPATRLGISYHERLLTSVRVVSPAATAPGLVTRLTAMGYAAAASDDPGLPHELWPMVYYRSGERTAALGLAGDLGLSPSQTSEAATAPTGLTLVTP